MRLNKGRAPMKIRNLACSLEEPRSGSYTYTNMHYASEAVQ